jgi:large subunit ribosomal protein L15
LRALTPRSRREYRISDLNAIYWDKEVKMTSKQASRSLQAIIRRARPSCQCTATSSRTSSIRHFSASSSRPEAEYENERAARPRWSYTPQKMIAPYPLQAKDPDKAWECNSDPAKLDRFYNKFLGRGGDSVLTEEVKWLAITHKSFDQGRRGFNDRLAFFGK